MTSPPAAFRLLSLAGVLVATLALLLAGCGETETAATEGSTTGVKAKTAAPATAPGCPRQLGAFVGSLRALRSQLAVGLAYEQYVETVKGLRAAYDEIPVGRLTLDCLAATGAPSEKALNKHVDAANAWGECLADASCATATIEPVLQRRWRVASRYLSEAR